MGTPTQLMEQRRQYCNWTGIARDPRKLGFHVIVVAMLCFAMPGARAEFPRPEVAAFDVDGLKLSMPFNAFRELYPDAEITEKTAARYCYGEEVEIDSLSRLGAVIRQRGAIVQISFGYNFFGRGISTIERDEAIEFDPSHYASLRDGLIRHYGPFTGLKYPKKWTLQAWLSASNGHSKELLISLSRSIAIPQVSPTPFVKQPSLRVRYQA